MNQAVIDLTPKVSKATTVMKGATLVIKGFKDALAAAVAAALANGATAEELVPLTELGTTMDAQTDELAAAVVENTGAPA